MKYKKVYESPAVVVLSSVDNGVHVVLEPTGDCSWRSHTFGSWYEAQQFAYRHDDKVIVAQRDRLSLLSRLEKIKLP